LEARAGIEPAHKGFADLLLGPETPAESTHNSTAALIRDTFRSTPLAPRPVKRRTPTTCSQVVQLAFGRGDAQGRRKDTAPHTAGNPRKIETVIRDSIAESDQPVYWKRLEWLRAIPTDKWQTAAQEFTHARTPAEVEDLVRHYPFMRSEGSVASFKCRQVCCRASVVRS